VQEDAMTRRPIPRFAVPRPVPPGRWRSTPPAIFPPLMGLFALGLGWRRAGEGFGLPAAAGEVILGAVLLLWLFAMVAYGTKLARRPAVVAEDLAVLPGRAGLAAATLSTMLAAAALAPYLPGVTAVLAVVALVAQGALALAVVASLLTGPAEARVVTPVLHLVLVGFIVAALPALALGWAGLAQTLMTLTLPVALVLWGASAVQFARRIPPAPLRPLLAIHAAPAALFGMVSAGLGLAGLAAVFAVLAMAFLAVLAAAGRWVTAAGFSALWGAFTFPLAATAGAALAAGGAAAVAGGVVLAGATVAVPLIALRIMRLWAQGDLAARTNAAIA
jgi:tellurite resistance protein